MKSFLHGKKALTVAPLSPLASPTMAVKPAAKPAPSSGAASAEDRPSPTVEVVKEGDKVVRLVVTCGCGERVEIECLYPDS